MDVAVLAGGLGTRLRSVVADRPKVLAEVAGRPFLAHLLQLVARNGARRAVLCTGYLADQVEAAFGAAFAGVEIVYSVEPTPLGTGGALRLALPALRTDQLLVLNGDSYVHAPFSEMLTQHRTNRADATLLLSRVADAGRYGAIMLDDDGRVRGFAEKRRAGEGWVSAGVYLLARELVASIPADRPVSLEREMFPAWTARRAYGYRSGQPFLDIGLPESLARARRSIMAATK